MSELGTTTVVGLGGLIIGIVFGAVVQRTNFCTMGGISDLVLMGDGRRFRAWLLAIAVAIIGTQALYFAGVIDINKSIYLSPNLGWLGAIIGGLMFGFGMTQTGGCASKTLVRLGSGNLKSLIVMVVLGIFAYMTPRGLLALPRLQIETTNIDLTARGLHNQNLGEMAGAAIGLAAGPARAAVAAALALLLLTVCFKDAAFRHSLPDIVSGVVIGLCAAAGWLVTGVLAADEFNPVQLASITFVAPAGDSLQSIVATIKGLSTDELEPRRKRSWWEQLFGGAGGKADKVLERYDPGQAQIDKITNDLDMHQHKLLIDIKSLDVLYQKTLGFYDELALYIAAGAAKLEELDKTVIPAAQAAADGAPGADNSTTRPLGTARDERITPDAGGALRY